MIRHYLKTALRNLSRQKLLSSINILGLSIGLACFILFLLYAVNEFSYDRFHTNGKDIYRVYRWSEAMQGEDASGDVYLPMPLGPAMKADLPQVVSFNRLQESWGNSFVKSKNKIISLPVTFADSNFFSFFSFPLADGNPSSALSQLNSVVLTQKTAAQLFGNNRVVGETVEIKLFDTYVPFTVSGIAENIPGNSSIQFEVLGNYAYLPTTANGARSINNWRRSAYQTYVQLKPGSTLASDNKTLAAFRKKYYPEEESSLRKEGVWSRSDAPVKYKLQPLRSIHTDAKVSGGSVSSIDPRNIWIALGIAGAVLLIACINFTTLSIGRSAGRAKEVGIRKVIGSMKKDVQLQFIAEAMLLTFIATVVGIGLSLLLLPSFNTLAGKQLVFSFQQYPEMIWILGTLLIIVGLIAGSYPAWMISSFKPADVLKSKIKVGGSNLFTKSLVTFQFVLSIGLIASTIIMLGQIKFMTGKNPGFKKENILVVDASGTKSKQLFPLFKQEIMANPAITAVAGAELGLGEGTGWSRSGFDYNGINRSVYEYFVDHNYIPLMGMQLIAGRNFDPRVADDTVHSVIVNEAMVQEFGWTVNTAVGQQLTGYGENFTPVVIGVVKNFNFRPLSEEIQPQLFHQFSDYTAFKYFIRLKPGHPANAIAGIQSAWDKLVPDQPLIFNFLDESLDRFYHSEKRWSGIVGWAGGLAVFLACLGLFGLAALSAINRTKEIGIRKVLGASVLSIVGLISGQFMRLVIIAIVIAVPLSWYIMSRWLRDFAYQMEIGWWIFGLAALIGITIALLTISMQAIRAGLTNPVKSLRSE
jgi:putative ABC transport system permease protein